MTPLLHVIGATRSVLLPDRSRLDILTGIDLEVAAGESVAIVGRSGSGKSTLLNLLGLLDTPTSGEVHIAGRAAATASDSERSQWRGRYIGFVFQQFHLLDRRTARENVAEPLLYGDLRERRERFARATELLAAVGLAERADVRPHQLSGGEQQRVAIARALARRPRVVLADEPTGSLDPATAGQVLDLLIALVRAESAGLVLVTHDADAARRADRVLTLADGQLHPAPPAAAHP